MAAERPAFVTRPRGRGRKAREAAEKVRAGRRSSWWELQDADELAASAWAFARGLYDAQSSERRERAEDCLSLYEGRAVSSLGLIAATVWGAEPASFNAIGAVVDTRASHVFRNRVRPYFLTSRGKWEEREKARGMQRAVEGAFHEAGIWGELGQHICWDGEVFEAGCAKVTPDYANSRLLIERVRAQDIYFDKRDALLGSPRQMVILWTCPRERLLNFFQGAPAEVRKAIEDAPSAPSEMYDDDEESTSETNDRVAVAELWHLPSGRVDRDKAESWKVGEAHDGRHTIILGGSSDKSHVLQDEAWPYPYFPVAFYRPKKRRRGFWSQSVPERLVGAQLTINRMLKRVDGIMNLHARPLVYVNKSARINTDKITNSWASIIEGNGPPGSAIQYITPQSVPAEYLAQIQRVISWCFEQEGVSELSAAAKKPAGIEAAVAIQALQDTESIRHTDVFRAWEDFHVQLARLVVDGYRLLAERSADFEVVWGDAKDLQRIKWKEVDLGEMSYLLQVWPTNLLPQTPSAKLQRVVEMMREQLITPQQGLLLLDFPDVEALLGDSNAAIKNINEKLDAAFRGEALKAQPHVYLALDAAWAAAIDRINALEADGAPSAKIDLLRQWAEDVNELRKLAAKNAAEITSPAPPAPPTAPEAA